MDSAMENSATAVAPHRCSIRKRFGAFTLFNGVVRLPPLSRYTNSYNGFVPVEFFVMEFSQNTADKVLGISQGVSLHTDCEALPSPLRLSVMCHFGANREKRTGLRRAQSNFPWKRFLTGPRLPGAKAGVSSEFKSP